MKYFLIVEQLIRGRENDPSVLLAAGIGLAVVLVLLGLVGFYFRKYFALLFKSLLRNPLRTVLTSMAVMVLVFMVVMIWSFLVVLDVVMTEQSKNFKAIVTERWKVPSQMPFAYAATLEEGAAAKPEDVRPDDSMTWQFYGGTLDPTNKAPDNFMFFFAMEPRKLRTMMDDLDTLDPELVKKLEANKRGAIVGRKRLEKLNKKVGERFAITSLSLQNIDLEFEIVGVFPEGRYDLSAVMNRDYLNDAIDQYEHKTGTKHPLKDRSLGLVWLKVPDPDTFSRVSGQIMSSSRYAAPAVKIETASSGIAAWLEPYKDILFGLKWFLVPSLLVAMTLVIANAIGISVRERRIEMAVLKVLGFSPSRILAIVLGEALLVSATSGLLSAALTYGLIHLLMGGINFPVAFFPKFDVVADTLWWGLLFGSLTGLCGSIIPAWSARTVKVSEVFAKVA